MSDQLPVNLQRARELIDQAATADPDAIDEMQAMLRSLSTEELTALRAALGGES
jgi:hypothetical protein